MLDVFVDSMIFEPSNYLTLHDNFTINISNLNTYIDNNIEPESLHYYLKEFARGDTIAVMTETECDADICTCIGPGNGKRDGFYYC
jgi:hypothetical protein